METGTERLAGHNIPTVRKQGAMNAMLGSFSLYSRSQPREWCSQLRGGGLSALLNLI